MKKKKKKKEDTAFTIIIRITYLPYLNFSISICENRIYPK